MTCSMAIEHLPSTTPDSHLPGVISAHAPISGTVPLGVWKLPHTQIVDISGNLLTQFTGESTPNWFID